jgi:hypothetical protein
LAFQEDGVRKLDGIIQFLQANAIPFSDRASLPKLVSDKVGSSWKPDWRNELSLTRDPHQFLDVPAVDRAGHAAGNRRFFYACVRNQHKLFAAAHAYVYLDSISSPEGDNYYPLKTIEVKWTGYLFPNAVIRPNTEREFDCLWVHEDDPLTAHFSVLADSEEYSPVIQGPGTFLLRYTVLADRFSPQSINLKLTLAPSLDGVSLVPS